MFSIPDLIRNFDEKLILQLLDMGAEVNHWDKHGKSTLEHVIDYENTESRKSLLIKCAEKGADVNYHIPFMLTEERKIKQTMESKKRAYKGSFTRIFHCTGYIYGTGQKS